MSKKKSLGSSPIAFKSQKSAMGFIPDRGVSDKKKHKDTAVKEGNYSEVRSSGRVKKTAKKK